MIYSLFLLHDVFFQKAKEKKKMIFLGGKKKKAKSDSDSMMNIEIT